MEVRTLGHNRLNYQKLVTQSTDLFFKEDTGKVVSESPVWDACETVMRVQLIPHFSSKREERDREGREFKIKLALREADYVTNPIPSLLEGKEKTCET
ncbi:hypothetical protein NDU88_005472 [Pleurodeles waltl]|uniref:Uncharacterized protein n=1 Tax=Pleurodeles waltl TaxID=8319 RepID=A0AAV7LLA5_PLEWA|nr:hypothetical protein NDU88_005472 [Pleurodeles waltl]